MKKIYSTIVKDLGPMAEDFIGEKNDYSLQRKCSC